MSVDLWRALLAAAPAATLWGASFPLALASVASDQQDPGCWVGRLYGANTIGTIAGSLVAGLWLVAWLGTWHTQQLLIAISGASALLALSKFPPGASARAGRFGFIFLLLPAAAVAALMASTVPPIPPELIAYGRHTNERGHARIVYAGEGTTTSIAVSETDNGVLNYHSAGKIQASSEFQDMRLQRILGHLTTLVPRNPQRMLVIGLGAGVTAGAVSIEPRLKQETVVEIEPLVPKIVSRYFSKYNYDVVAQPNVRVVVDDGRHFLLTTKERFDGITSDPLDPWVKGTAALYTREFFELARQHLSPGGVLTQFVQLYESNEDAVKCELATFFDVFPNGIVFSNTVMGEGYDLVLLGRADDQPIDVDQMESRLQSSPYARVAQSLSEIGVYSAADLLATYIGKAEDFRPWLAGAAINRDRNLRLQYLAGLGLNLVEGGEIYAHMTAFGPHFSPDVFRGSSELLDYLAQAIESGSARY